MGLSAGVQRFFEVVVGMAPAEGDVGALKAMSDTWLWFDGVLERFGEGSRAAASGFEQAMSGATADSVVKQYRVLVPEDVDHVRVAVRGFAQATLSAAREFEKADGLFYGMAAMLAAMIVELSWSFVTAPAIPALIAAVRALAMGVMRALVARFGELGLREMTLRLLSREGVALAGEAAGAAGRAGVAWGKDVAARYGTWEAAGRSTLSRSFWAASSSSTRFESASDGIFARYFAVQRPWRPRRNNFSSCWELPYCKLTA